MSPGQTRSTRENTPVRGGIGSTTPPGIQTQRHTRQRRNRFPLLRFAGAAIAGVLLTATAVAAQSISPPPTPLSLDQAVTRALAANPELRVARADTGLALAALVGSRLRPNPSLTLEAISNGDARASVTQDLQLWGVRANRIRAASLEQERTRYSAVDVARIVRREVALSYRELAFQRERAALLDSLVGLNQQVARTATLALEQGLGSELDAQLSGIALDQSRLDRDAAIRLAEIEQVQLARLLGDGLTAVYQLSDSQLPTRLPFLTAHLPDAGPRGAVRFQSNEAGLDSLVRLALDTRPDLRAAQFAVETQQASLAAAHGAAKPTVVVGAIYTRTLDAFAKGQREVDNGVGLGFVIGLPMRSRNEGEIARARFAGSAAELGVASLRQAVERDVRVAVGHAALAAERLETLRQAILPANQSALRLARVAFERGQVNIFQVLQIQRLYADALTALLEATREYSTALADLEAGVGASIQ